MLPCHRCFKSGKPAASNQGKGQRLHAVSALPAPLAAWKARASRSGGSLTVYTLELHDRPQKLEFCGVSFTVVDGFVLCAQESVSNAGKAALLAAMLSAGVSFAPPNVHVLQPAHADDEVLLLCRHAVSFDQAFCIARPDGMCRQVRHLHVHAILWYEEPQTYCMMTACMHAQAGMSASSKRAFTNERRKAILAKA